MLSPATLSFLAVLWAAPANAGNVRSRSLAALPTISPFELLDSETEGVVTVRVRQSMVGECVETADDVADNAARIFGYIYLDPDTLEETCWLGREVSACFKRTLPIGCDPATNTAKIELYVVDETYHPNRDIVPIPNPKVGRCMPGKDIMKRAVGITETFECATVSTGQEAPPETSEQEDRADPSDLEDPRLSLEEQTKEPEIGTGGDSLAPVCGADSGGECSDGFYCLQDYPNGCTFQQDVDVPPVGRCVELGADCSMSSDCNTEKGEWCEPYFGKCAPVRELLQCCFGEADNECGMNSVCGMDMSAIGMSFSDDDFRCAPGPCPDSWLCL